MDINKTAHEQAMAMHQAATPEQPAGGESTPKQSPQQQTAPQGGQPDQQGMDGPLSPDEEQLVHALTMRGYDENDVEQAIVMVRQGMTLPEVIQAIGAKHNGQ